MDKTGQDKFAGFVLEQMSDGVYWIRRDGGLLYVNQGACDMLGYTRSELLARTIFDVNPVVNRESWDKVWQALVEQRHVSFQSTHRTRDGRSLTVDIVSRVFEMDGEVYSCAVARDVSTTRPVELERQREHAFVESLIEMAPVLVVLLDAEGRILRLNRWTEQVTGYARGEVRGKDWVEVFVPDADQDKVRLLLQQSFAGAAMRGGVYAITTKSGGLRNVVWYDQLVSRAEAVGVGLLIIGQDVTEQRELEQRLRQAEKMEAVGQLAGGIAHDFNNQLTGIMGWAEILGLEVGDNASLREGVERIMLASNRARDVVAQLLAYSRKGKHVTKDVDLHALVNEVAAVLRSGLDPRISIVLDLRAEYAHTSGDPTQLGNAVLNLGLNARDAMPDGGTLTLATRSVTVDAGEAARCSGELRPGEFVELCVRDTGTGMDAETQQRMFEPFFTTKSEGRGTGLGLAAVYGTVKSHHGAITTRSTLGRGTEICIRLPTNLSVPQRIDGANEVSGGLAAQGEPIPAHVIVVDDEAPVREVCARLLRRLGCQVTAFASGFEAIDHYRDNWPGVDIVVLDMIMPMLDGKSTFFALRKINPKANIILISGYSVEGAAQSLLDQGAKGFLQKPFTMAEMRDVLVNIPRRRARP
jgi:two-component system cell cycle sensor histidine kinase/response regulator CckA